MKSWPKDINESVKNLNEQLEGKEQNQNKLKVQSSLLEMD